MVQSEIINLRAPFRKSPPNMVVEADKNCSNNKNSLDVNNIGCLDAAVQCCRMYSMQHISFENKDSDRALKVINNQEATATPAWILTSNNDDVDDIHTHRTLSTITASFCDHYATAADQLNDTLEEEDDQFESSNGDTAEHDEVGAQQQDSCPFSSPPRVKSFRSRSMQLKSPPKCTPTRSTKALKSLLHAFKPRKTMSNSTSKGGRLPDEDHVGPLSLIPPLSPLQHFKSPRRHQHNPSTSSPSKQQRASGSNTSDGQEQESEETRNDKGSLYHPRRTSPDRAASAAVRAANAATAVTYIRPFVNAPKEIAVPAAMQAQHQADQTDRQNSKQPYTGSIALHTTSSLTSVDFAVHVHQSERLVI